MTSGFERAVQESLANPVEAAATLAALEGRLGALIAAREAQVVELGAWGKSACLGLILLATCLGGVLSVALRRKTVAPLLRVIDELGAGAEQTAAAASQVAESSHSVATGASRQAASLEEISASIEELSGVTSQNAGYCQEARQLVEQTDGLMKQAREVMRQSRQAMEGITEASEEAAKVVKTIDEIAFQTNLLALNAAVEAARAGDAGMGFAVVAEEVRNLAQRSASAARDTTRLINDTLTRIQEGDGLVQRADEAYREVAVASKQVMGLVNQIADSSRQQAQGTEQLATAVNQVDGITQANAAGAQQSASASEELTAQASVFKQVVADLKAVVGMGGGSPKPPRAASQAPVRARAQAQARPSFVPRTKAAPMAPTQSPRPEDIIPLGEEDGAFRDF
jgi:methyl-accepting chemotaxis protein